MPRGPECCLPSSNSLFVPVETQKPPSTTPQPRRSCGTRGSHKLSLSRPPSGFWTKTALELHLAPLQIAIPFFRSLLGNPNHSKELFNPLYWSLRAGLPLSNPRRRHMPRPLSCVMSTFYYIIFRVGWNAKDVPDRGILHPCIPSGPVSPGCGATRTERTSINLWGWPFLYIYIYMFSKRGKGK